MWCFQALSTAPEKSKRQNPKLPKHKSPKNLKLMHPGDSLIMMLVGDHIKYVLTSPGPFQHYPLALKQI